MKIPAIQLKPAIELMSKHLQEFLAVPIAIGGGMHPKAAAMWAYVFAIQKALQARGDCVEIGVFRGWGSFLPGRSLEEGERCVLVDISEHNLKESRTFLREVAGTNDDRLIDVLVDSAGGNAQAEIVSRVQRARWIHIDGEHSYAAVIADLDTAAKIATHDAVICVDDVDHPLATCIDDAIHEWLRANRSWQLLIRGYNKAYIVSTRCVYDWRRFVEILPEVFDRFLGMRTVLASQTSSAGSSYFSYGEPFNDFKYLKVNATSGSLEQFEGVTQRAFLLGESCVPEILVFGNCQMQVLHYGLAAAMGLCGMALRTRYVADVHELDEAGAEAVRDLARTSVGLVSQVVAGEKFLVRSAELEQLCQSDLVLRVPSIHFNAYWPNHADLRMQGGSAVAAPTDALAYLMIRAGGSDEEIARLLEDAQLYSEAEILAWHDSALHRLRIREEQHRLDASVSDLLAGSIGGARLFFTFNHPRKRVLDHVMIQILRGLARYFEPRNREVFEGIVEGRITVRYDMSTIDFVDLLPLASVRRILSSGESNPSLAKTYRFARQRGSDEVHRAIDVRSELRALRTAYEGLDDEHHAFNLSQIEQNCVIPGRITGSLSLL